MSDLERYSADSPYSGLTDSDEEIPVLAMPADTSTERAGLPRTYQMRADSHYVDQLESRAAAPAIRMIPTCQIEGAVPLPSGDLDVLTRSIAAHGIVQPLLVRRHNGGFQIIAGRRRLAAAISSRLTDVPCLVHDADNAEAAALALAENVRSAPPPEATDPPATVVRLNDLLPELLADLARISRSAALLAEGSANGFLQSRIAADLIQAQAWRTSWMLNATALVAGESEMGRPKSIASIFERVVAGFEPEARLTRLQLHSSVAANASSIVFDDHLGVVAITAGILTTLAWLQRVSEPRIELRADAPHPPAFRVEIVQRMAPVPPHVGRFFLQPEMGRPGHLSDALAARVLKKATVELGGTAEGVAINGSGSVVQCTFVPKPAA